MIRGVTLFEEEAGKRIGEGDETGCSEYDEEDDERGAELAHGCGVNSDSKDCRR